MKQLELHLARYGKTLNGKEATYSEIADYFNVFQNKSKRKRGEAVRSVYRRVKRNMHMMPSEQILYTSEPVREPELIREYKEALEKGRISSNLLFKAFSEPVIEWPEEIDSKYDSNNVLVIGDIHEPFTETGYLEHCLSVRERFNCGKVIFIGDIIDNNFSSYHTVNPDGFAAGEELNRAIKRIRRWYKAFPNAVVILGNHDNNIQRKLFSSGISKRWMRDFGDVLGVPNWKFVSQIEIDEVLYIHGEGATAKTQMKNYAQSVVCGHRHTEAYIEYLEARHKKLFAMQVGSGVSRESYAMAYAKNFKKQILSCAVVLDKGTLPILVPFNKSNDNTRARQIQQNQILRRESQVQESVNEQKDDISDNVPGELQRKIQQELLALLQSISKERIHN